MGPKTTPSLISKGGYQIPPLAWDEIDTPWEIGYMSGSSLLYCRGVLLIPTLTYMFRNTFMLGLKFVLKPSHRQTDGPSSRWFVVEP